MLPRLTIPRTLPALAAGLLLTVAPGPLAPSAHAQGGRADVHSAIAVSKDKHTLAGRLTSSKRACTSKVIVTLFYRGVGEHNKIAFQRVTTDAQGRWHYTSTDRRYPSGFYRSSVPARPGCQADRSRNVAVN